MNGTSLAPPVPCGRRKDGAAAILAALVAVSVAALYYDRGIDPFDAGLFAAEAQRVLHGGAYGRDFLAPYGPGRYYLVAGLFALFGSSLKVQACLWLALRGCVSVLTYAVGRAFLSPRAAFLPVLALALAPGALHKGFFQLVGLAGPLLYLWSRRSPRGAVYFTAGVLLGAGSLFRVDAGLFGLAVLLGLLWIERLWDRPAPSAGTCLRRSAALLAGAAAVLLLPALWILVRGDPGTLLAAEWRRTLNVSAFAGTIRLPDPGAAGDGLFPAAWKPWLLVLMLYAAPAVLLLLAGRSLYRRLRGGGTGARIETFGLSLFGLLLLNQVRITPTFNHLLHAIPIPLVAAAVLLPAPSSRAAEGSSSPMERGVRFCLALLFLGLPPFYNLAYTRGVLPGSPRNRAVYTRPLRLDRAGVYETAEEAEALERIVGYIRSTTPPGTPLFAGPFSPVLNFLADRPPATRFLEPFYYFGDERLQGLLVEDLERTRPPLVVLDAVRSVGRSRLETDAPRVQAYLRNHYRPAGPRGPAAGRYELWLRR